MNIRHTTLKIESGKPFANCRLKRESSAETLTKVIQNYKDGFVLAINNEWGTGKTTFIRMWEQYLKDRNYSTIYFNAWENDLDENPLVAIISELKRLLIKNPKNEKIFEKVVKNAAIISKSIAPKILKEVFKKYIFDSDTISEIIEGTSKVGHDIFENELDNYIKKKNSITEFRESLSSFLKTSDLENPVVFFIDELDRCRPNYSVETLEQLKHFFSVEGIIFVLSIDKQHLGSSIKGFYGSESINSEEYLRRFIDIEYTLPKPNEKEFCEFLFHYYSFKDFFYSEQRITYREFNYDHQDFLTISEILAIKTKATLRQIDNIFSRTRLIISFFPSNSYIFPPILTTLIFLKVLRNDLYKKIEINDLSISELDTEISNILSIDFSISHDINIDSIIAHLLFFYNNNQEHHKRIDLHERSNEPLISYIEQLSKNGLDRYHNHFSKITRSNYYNMKLSVLIDKINLLNTFVKK